MQSLLQIFRDKDLRKKILVVLGLLVVFRIAAAVPIPGVDIDRLRAFLQTNEFLGLLNVFSGGALTNLSIVMLGVGPYITASIIMQLMMMVFPKLKELYQEEGEAGRQRFNQYSRLLTVPLAILQGFALLSLLQSQGVLGALSSYSFAINIVIVTAGSIFLMWLGELITEYGIGNGTSLIIFAGIVSTMPADIGRTLFAIGRPQFPFVDPAQIPMLLGFVVASIVVIAAVVFITEGERPIPVSYAKRVRGMRVYGGFSTYLPLRVNQGGVIPIIFALSILLFPQMIGTVLARSSNEILKVISGYLLALSPDTFAYGAFYFLLVFLFTYFYTAVTFDPDQISENLQKSGGFVPGIRPGRNTSEYLYKVISRITLVGALFLG
jgi:preprotein translocase subunit SecY